MLKIDVQHTVSKKSKTVDLDVFPLIEEIKFAFNFDKFFFVGGSCWRQWIYLWLKLNLFSILTAW